MTGDSWSNPDYDVALKVSYDLLMCETQITGLLSILVFESPYQLLLGYSALGISLTHCMIKCPLWWPLYESFHIVWLVSHLSALTTKKQAKRTKVYLQVIICSRIKLNGLSSVSIPLMTGLRCTFPCVLYEFLADKWRNPPILSSEKPVLTHKCCLCISPSQPPSISVDALSSYSSSIKHLLSSPPEFPGHTICPPCLRMLKGVSFTMKVFMTPLHY